MSIHQHVLYIEKIRYFFVQTIKNKENVSYKHTHTHTIYIYVRPWKRGLYGIFTKTDITS